MKDLLVTDYKKWLLYTFNSQNFKAHYELYHALKRGESFGSISVVKSSDNDRPILTVTSSSIDEDLQLSEVQRGEFIRYLIDNYFQTDQVDELLENRERQAESAANHRFVDYADHGYPHAIVDVKPHPKESLYFRIRLAIAILVYLALIVLIVYGVISNPIIAAVGLVYLPFVGLFLLLRYASKGIFTGLIRGNSVRITKDQYPEIYQIVEEQAGKLQVGVPEIYITAGHFNAFVTKFARSHILLIFSEVVETALKGNYEVLKYVTAHELCHIKQRHLSKEKWLFPSKLIPFLGLAYSLAVVSTRAIV